jgi:hypothetical protein
MQSQDYIVDEDGNFRFTMTGLESQAPLLAKAGIDAHKIRTYSEYIQARQAASPYFMEYFREEADDVLRDKPNTLEWNAIRSIAYGSADEQDKMLSKLKLKKSMKIV